MQVVELSNHPGDMLNDVSLRRRAASQRAQDRYADELIQHQARVQTIRVKRDRARRQHQWWTWLRLAFAVAAEKRRAPRPFSAWWSSPTAGPGSAPAATPRSTSGPRPTTCCAWYTSLPATSVTSETGNGPRSSA
jgi:hypothetical protein